MVLGAPGAAGAMPTYDKTASTTETAADALAFAAQGVLLTGQGCAAFESSGSTTDGFGTSAW